MYRDSDSDAGTTLAARSMRTAVCGRNSPSQLLQEMEKQRKAVQADWGQYVSRAYNGAQDERRPGSGSA